MTVVAVLWSGVDCVDAIVVGREGQWKINNDERGGGSAAVAATISATLVLVRVCFGVPCCCCCCRRGAPVLIFLRFSTDRFVTAVEFARHRWDDGF